MPRRQRRGRRCTARARRGSSTSRRSSSTARTPTDGPRRGPGSRMARDRADARSRGAAPAPAARRSSDWWYWVSALPDSGRSRGRPAARSPASRRRPRPPARAAAPRRSLGCRPRSPRCAALPTARISRADTPFVGLVENRRDVPVESSGGLNQPHPTIAGRPSRSGSVRSSRRPGRRSRTTRRGRRRLRHERSRGDSQAAVMAAWIARRSSSEAYGRDSRRIAGGYGEPPLDFRPCRIRRLSRSRPSSPTRSARSWATS